MLSQCAQQQTRVFLPGWMLGRIPEGSKSGTRLNFSPHQAASCASFSIREAPVKGILYVILLDYDHQCRLANAGDVEGLPISKCISKRNKLAAMAKMADAVVGSSAIRWRSPSSSDGAGISRTPSPENA